MEIMVILTKIDVKILAWIIIRVCIWWSCQDTVNKTLGV